MEQTAEVIDGEQSVVFDQAENRMHVQNILILSLPLREITPKQTLMVSSEPTPEMLNPAETEFQISLEETSASPDQSPEKRGRGRKRKY